MKLTRTHTAKGTVVRVYLPQGLYPAKSFLHERAAFHVLDDIVFSVIRISRPNDEWLERPWSFPDEIRLMAAVALSTDGGMLYPYPSSLTFSLSGHGRRLKTPELGLEVAELLRAELPKVDRNVIRDPDLLALPPAKYETNEMNFRHEHMTTLFNAIDVRDDLMIRGLGALLKGPLLSQHHCFHTEACFSLHVAMEASGVMIRQHLEAEGKPSSYVDAGDFIAEAFGQNDRGIKYFQDFYDDRIVTSHPESRHGIFADAPLAADDFYDLYHNLIEVYDFILTGTVNAQG